MLSICATKRIIGSFLTKSPRSNLHNNPFDILNSELIDAFVTTGLAAAQVPLRPASEATQIPALDMRRGTPPERLCPPSSREQRRECCGWRGWRGATYGDALLHGGPAGGEAVDAAGLQGAVQGIGLGIALIPKSKPVMGSCRVCRWYKPLVLL